ncbi:hypothetical protein ACQV5I_08110 [Leptospira interrogans]
MIESILLSSLKPQSLSHWIISNLHKTTLRTRKYQNSSLIKAK